MSKRTFASRTFAPRHFNSATWTGEGVVAVIQPVDGWIAGVRSRLLVSESRERLAIGQTRNRVWIARDK